MNEYAVRVHVRGYSTVTVLADSDDEAMGKAQESDDLIETFEISDAEAEWIVEGPDDGDN